MSTSKASHIACNVRKTKSSAYWTRIGAVFAHTKGGGFAIQIAAIPQDGKIVRPPPKKKLEGEKRSP